MHLTALLGKTLRQPPSDAHLTNHQLLVRAGYVRTLEAGLFAYLPLGHQLLQRLRTLVRSELSSVGGQEILIPAMPDTDPASSTVRLARREIDSYRQLPTILFHMADQSAPEPSSRDGLFSAGERPIVKMHAFDRDDLGVEDEIQVALERVLSACEVEVVWAEAGDEGRRAYFIHPAGDDFLVHCPNCTYAAERSWAATPRWPEPPDEPELLSEEIETPGCDTIAALAEFLDIPAARTLKMVFYSVEGKVTCTVIRGDRQVDEAKLARVLGTDWYYISL
ncbi:MAG: YbaK/EbsC family protein, partial [Anaerolineae bacterium]